MFNKKEIESLKLKVSMLAELCDDFATDQDVEELRESTYKAMLKLVEVFGERIEAIESYLGIEFKGKKKEERVIPAAYVKAKKSKKIK